MAVERAAEPPVRTFRRWDTVRVEMVDVKMVTAGWSGTLFRGVTVGGTRYRKGQAWTCAVQTWTELTPEPGG